VFRLSDIIEDFIKELMEQEGTDILEIQRNQLAEHFACAPSQINYVLSTRFTIDKGYYVESRRGGGGYIRIRKLEVSTAPYLSRLINEYIGREISQFDAYKIIRNLEEKGIITRRERSLMEASVSDRSINVFSPTRDIVRAGILKAMLTILIMEG
jgi:transcriptional regulator CtsR